jgi:hypothetical protein
VALEVIEKSKIEKRNSSRLFDFKEKEAMKLAIMVSRVIGHGKNGLQFWIID